MSSQHKTQHKRGAQKMMRIYLPKLFFEISTCFAFCRNGNGKVFHRFGGTRIFFLRAHCWGWSNFLRRFLFARLHRLISKIFSHFNVSIISLHLKVASWNIFWRGPMTGNPQRFLSFASFCWWKFKPKREIKGKSFVFPLPEKKLRKISRNNIFRINSRLVVSFLLFLFVLFRCLCFERETA